MMFYNTPADFLSHLPERLQSVTEFSALADAANLELDAVNAAISTMVSNAAISTANAAGLARWEAILGVSTPLSGTLKSRREALMARLKTKPPINLDRLRGIIETYMGVQVEIGLVDSVVLVVYRGTAKVADLRPLYAMIYETIPASLLVQIAYKYLIWYELDAQVLKFSTLDAKSFDWNTLERGEWIG